MIAKLPKETEEQIQSLVETGEYGDSTDVVVRAVQDLARRRDQAVRL
jgi:Arc/MetJ-type ribon-helix-helix transcriptional regulator